MEMMNMKKTLIHSIGETLFIEHLENGLTIYMLPKTNVNNVYATFTTRYGGMTKDFLSSKTGNYTSMPNGIAHFLEHKMFEQKDGLDPFMFYAQTGADCNAFTSLSNTTYLFYGVNHLAKNINYLLDFVQQPYFTDENVEKEKGIIEQEIKMYEDNPYAMLEEGIRYNSFIHHPIRHSIIGTKEDIYSLNKELLYECYEKFYHPRNMFLVITGNFNVDQVVEMVQKNQAKKTFKTKNEIKLKEIDEPNNVYKEYGEKKHAILIPKLGLNIKIPLKGIEMDRYSIHICLSLFFKILFGSTSLFFEKAQNEGYIDFPLSFDVNDTDSHVLYSLFCDSKEPEKTIQLMKETLLKKEITEDDFKRKKKVYSSTEILLYEDIRRINHHMIFQIIEYGSCEFDMKERLNNLTVDQFMSFVHQIQLSNQTVFVIKPKE